MKKENTLMNRMSKENYYLNIAEAVAERGSCLRRNYGAVIVKNDEVISTGYTGSPRGTDNCCDTGVCKRTEMNIPRGERYDLSESVHAEQNALLSIARKDAMGATLYLVGIEGDHYVDKAEPCTLCKRFIKNMGIKKVVIRDTTELFRVEMQGE